MTYTIEIDPAQVLDVPPNATLEAIRAAYRTQVKKYHPDHGGASWAFRLVTRSYEQLSRARVAGRLADEVAGSASTAPGAPDPVDPLTRTDADGVSVRSGFRDPVDSPGLLVDVELLLLRLELEDPYALLTSDTAARNLSCSLNVTWPAADARGEAVSSAADVIPKLRKAFGQAMLQVRPISQREDARGDDFRGWLAYETARRASESFNALRKALKARGLGTRQWTREIVIPRGEA